MSQKSDHIPSYYQEQKKYNRFKGGIYENPNIQNKDDVVESPTHINFNTNENDNNTVDTVEDVRRKDDISTMDGDKHDNDNHTISNNDNDNHPCFT